MAGKMIYDEESVRMEQPKMSLLDSNQDFLNQKSLDSLCNDNRVCQKRPSDLSPPMPMSIGMMRLPYVQQIRQYENDILICPENQGQMVNPQQIAVNVNNGTPELDYLETEIKSEGPVCLEDRPTPLKMRAVVNCEEQKKLDRLSNVDCIGLVEDIDHPSIKKLFLQD